MTFRIAKLIFDGYHGYKTNFDSITKNAGVYFEEKNWEQLQKDVKHRLYLHKNFVYGTVDLIKQYLGYDSITVDYWHKVYDEFSSQVCLRKDIELAFTFFFSVTRKIYPDFIQKEDVTTSSWNELRNENLVCKSYLPPSSLMEIIRDGLRNLPVSVEYNLREEDVSLICNRLNKLIEINGYTSFNAVKLAESLFYRNKTAYLAGKIILNAKAIIPFLIALVNRSEGLQADAVISTSEELEVIFSFTRAYFLVDTAYPSAMVSFLQTLMPGKRSAELYNSLGYNKHGKTLLFKELHLFLRASNEKFVIAPGIPGMVMTVFTLKSFHTVFKIIKDEFDPVKTVTRKDVLEKYRLVYKHDRYGRLADTHEFDHLAFNQEFFSTEVIQELEKVASRTVKIKNGKVFIRHAFTERKMCPLNIFIEEHSADECKEVIIDYGNALKELAYANIFPGDLLTKNFGVTKDKRVVFYDYDEITFVTSCNFKKIPIPQSMQELYAAHPAYEISSTDIFPEEFRNYLVPEGILREIFVAAHPEIFEVEFWEDIKRLHLDGFPFEIISYDKKNCLR